MGENDPNALLLLGEIRGQLRELVHTGNNNGQKIDALGNEMSGLKVAVAQLPSLIAKLEMVTSDVEGLKADKNRRDGAVGLVEWTVKNWPGVAGFVVLVLGLLAYAQGRLG